MDILNQAKDLRGTLVAWRRALHACPEIGFDLPRTKALILQELTAMGYSPKEVGRGSIIAHVGPAEGAEKGNNISRVGAGSDSAIAHVGPAEVAGKGNNISRVGAERDSPIAHVGPAEVAGKGGAVARVGSGSDSVITHVGPAEVAGKGNNVSRVGAERDSAIAHVGPAEVAGNGNNISRVGHTVGAGVLLRADMDGLAIPEAAKVEFRATNGNMHACGHDMHAAMLLGAAAMLKARERELSRGVRLLFQGAEETLQGAADAVAHGVCEGIGAAYMIHVTVNTRFPVGTVIVPPAGVIAPSADYFEITVRGKGCHGADPASGIDPLSAAARILLGLQHLPAREFPSGERGMLTVGMIHGGDAFNVIPEAARLGGSLRCYGEEFRQTLKTRTEQIACGVAEAFRTRAEVRFPAQCPSLVNDEGLRNRLCHALRGELGTDRLIVVDTPTGTAGSEDFAVISRTVPSVMLALAAGDPTVALHHPGIVFDEDALVYGTAALVTAAMQ